MNLPTWYSAGTVSVESGGTTVTLSGGLWGDDAIMAGDLFCDPAQPLLPPQRVKEVTAANVLELWAPWPGADMTDAAYEIRYVGIIERSTAQTRKVLEQLGEVSAYFDVQVDDTAARLALETADNPLRANYRVLVSNIGDGSAAIYSKATSAYGNWTDPAPYSGPKGDEGDPGPQGARGITWRGAYDPEAAYVLDDGVRDNGSSWRTLQPTTGNAPPVYPVTANDWWELVAAKGQDGTGTGDVVGPAGATTERVAVFDGATGKLLKDGGKTLGELLPPDDSIGAEKLATSALPLAPINLRVAASVASNALTVALKGADGTDPSAANPVRIPFRAATLGSGAIDWLKVTAAASLVVSVGSSLGFASGVAGRLWLVAFNDAGTLRLGLINCLNGINIFPLQQFGVGSSAAEGGAGAADSAHVFYTGAAVTDKAYTVLAHLDWGGAGLAVAGSWASGPTRIQPVGPGSKLPGALVQRVSTVFSSYATGNTQLPFDDTIPQNTEGTQFMTQAITPAFESNLVRVSAQFGGSIAVSGNIPLIAIFQDAVVDARAGIWGNTSGLANEPFQVLCEYLGRPGVVASTTYKTRVGSHQAGVIVYFNGWPSTRYLGGVMASNMQIEEYVA